jgi:hypothetical protein
MDDAGQRMQETTRKVPVMGTIDLGISISCRDGTPHRKRKPKPRKRVVEDEMGKCQPARARTRTYTEWEGTRVWSTPYRVVCMDTEE